MEQELCFTGKTDKENSLICPMTAVPETTIDREDGWRAMRIKGILGFSRIGILSGISSELSKHAIGILAISTFNTDYILVKADDLERALSVLQQKGYSLK